MKSIYIKFIFCSVLLSVLSLHSCTLDEYNPGAFTKEALATSIDGYETLINQCYFAMERFYYGAADWMSLTEGDTDLWTYKANESTSYTLFISPISAINSSSSFLVSLYTSLCNASARSKSIAIKAQNPRLLDASAFPDL